MLNFLSTDAEKILTDDYVNGKKLQDKTLGQMKEEYKFDEIKDAFDEGKIPPSSNYFSVVTIIILYMPVIVLSLNEDNNEFVSFLCSDVGNNIMTNNSLSIHVETGDMSYNDFNTNENFYSFLLAQQEEPKQFFPERISYHYSFQKYTRNFLPSFSLGEIDKLDLLSDKSAKYLFYKFDDWIELMGGEKVLIRHTSKVRDEVGLQKIEENNRQFFIEKIIAKIESKKPYAIETEKEPEIMLEIEKNYKICRRVYQSLFYEIAETFIQYINTLTTDEIEQLDADLRPNCWGFKSIVEVEDCIELLKLF